MMATADELSIAIINETVRQVYRGGAQQVPFRRTFSLWEICELLDTIPEPKEEVMATADELSIAIINETVLQFDYHREGGLIGFEAPFRRTFSPWEITDDDTNVIGWDHDREGVRKFALRRIVEIRPYTADSYVLPSS